MTNPNDSAFPQMRKYVDLGDGETLILYSDIALTKREYFAAVALQGIIASPNTTASWEIITEVSVKVADLLIEQLNKQPEDGKETK